MKMYLNGIKVRIIFEKHIKRKPLRRPDSVTLENQTLL